MKQYLLVIFASVVFAVGSAWAIVGETTIVPTDGGKPIPEARISVTFKTDTGRTIRKITTTTRTRITIPDRTTKIDITVTTRRKQETQTNIDVGLLTGRDYEIEIPGGGPPDFATPDDPTGPLIGGGVGGRTAVCKDYRTTQIVTKSAADPMGQDPDACMSSGVRGSVYIGTSTRFSGNWMAGVEAEFGYADTGKTIDGIPGSINGVPGVTAGVASNDRVSLKETWDLSFRGRLGYFVAPSVVVYGTFGLALQQVKTSLTCSAAGACGVNAIPAFTASDSSTLVGWTAGGGVEKALTSRWVIRGEYRYSDYGHNTVTLGTPANLALTADVHMRTHTALLGIAYKFGN